VTGLKQKRMIKTPDDRGKSPRRPDHRKFFSVRTMAGKRTYLFIALLSLAGLGAANPAARRVKEGNRLFGEKKYDQALVKYSEAQQELPDSPEVIFNIGDVHYRRGEYGKAGSLFGQAGKSADPALQSQALYNLGNTRYREEKLEEALATYKNSIELNPSDQDAKFNYELVRLKLQEQQNQPQKPPPPEEKKEKEEDKEKDKETKQQEQQPAAPPPRPSPEEDKQPASPQPQEQKMNPEDVERLLDALLSEEEDQREPVERREPAKLPEVLKDW
jgi:Ca-activated chloride channel family protein